MLCVLQDQVFQAMETGQTQPGDPQSWQDTSWSLCPFSYLVGQAQTLWGLSLPTWRLQPPSPLSQPPASFENPQLQVGFPSLAIFPLRWSFLGATILYYLSSKGHPSWLSWVMCH